MRCNLRSSRPLATTGLARAFFVCNGNGGLAGTSPGLPLPSQSLAREQAQGPLERKHHHGSSGKVQHVIVIKENCSTSSKGPLIAEYNGIRRGQPNAL